MDNETLAIEVADLIGDLAGYALYKPEAEWTGPRATDWRRCAPAGQTIFLMDDGRRIVVDVEVRPAV